jgi:hypothetical protein
MRALGKKTCFVYQRFKVANVCKPLPSLPLDKKFFF